MKDYWTQVQVTKLEIQLLEQQLEKLNQTSDESARFGNTIADMLRRVPDENRPQAMFGVYKILLKSQQTK